MSRFQKLLSKKNFYKLGKIISLKALLIKFCAVCYKGVFGESSIYNCMGKFLMKIREELVHKMKKKMLNSQVTRWHLKFPSPYLC